MLTSSSPPHLFTSSPLHIFISSSLHLFTSSTTSLRSLCLHLLLSAQALVYILHSCESLPTTVYRTYISSDIPAPTIRLCASSSSSSFAADSGTQRPHKSSSIEDDTCFQDGGRNTQLPSVVYGVYVPILSCCALLCCARLTVNSRV